MKHEERLELLTKIYNLSAEAESKTLEEAQYDLDEINYLTSKLI